ncbi:MAG: tellurite resistance/C4-dicarboxylate transporter family protein [Streptosporangiales bacterium]
MQGGGREGLAGRFVRDLYPGGFAAVMATGAVSVGISYRHLEVLSLAMLAVGLALFAVLLVAHVWRAVAYPRRVAADGTDPASAFGYLTFVAAADVLSTRLALAGEVYAAIGFAIAGVLAWLVLGYGIPLLVMFRTPGAAVLARVNGSWLMWVVATQSVAVASATLHPVSHDARVALAFMAVACWSVGIVLYLVIVVFLGVRILFRTPNLAELGPPYWILMGATAITVASGGQVLQLTGVHAVELVRPVVAGLSLLLWSFGSWLVPLLVAGSIWEWMREGRRLQYDAALWAMVFPLGMYSVATDDFGMATHLHPMTEIGTVATWVAFAAWCVTFAAMLVAFTRRLSEPHGAIAP